MTGMSGVGKSTVLAELARRGHPVVDTDDDGWSEEVPIAEPPGWEQRWREDRLAALLAEPTEGPLFVSGTASNQGRFYDHFAAVMVLTAPIEVLVHRLMSRPKSYGRSPADRARVAHEVVTVEPLLRASATAVIDTRRPVAEVADELESIAHPPVAR